MAGFVCLLPHNAATDTLHFYYGIRTRTSSSDYLQSHKKCTSQQVRVSLHPLIKRVYLTKRTVFNNGKPTKHSNTKACSFYSRLL